MSVATDPKGWSIYAVQARGHCDVLDPDGKTTRTFPIEVGSHGITTRVARQADGSEGFLTFGHWGPSVTALKGDGTKRWEEVSGQGVDDVWAADLDGDGTDEAIIGYNGATGLHVFSPTGTRLWKRTDMGNVWNVTAGDLDGDGLLEVVTTSAQGKVHVFAAKDGCAGHVLRTGDLRHQGPRRPRPGKATVEGRPVARGRQRFRTTRRGNGRARRRWEGALDDQASRLGRVVRHADGFTRRQAGRAGLPGRAGLRGRCGQRSDPGPGCRPGIQSLDRMGHPRRWCRQPGDCVRRRRGQRIPRQAVRRLTAKQPALSGPVCSLGGTTRALGTAEPLRTALGIISLRIPPSDQSAVIRVADRPHLHYGRSSWGLTGPCP